MNSWSPEIENALAAFVDGEAEPDALALLDDTMRTDPALVRALADLLAVDSLLRQHAEPDSDGFTEAVRFRILESHPQESAIQATGAGGREGMDQSGAFEEKVFRALHSPPAGHDGNPLPDSRRRKCPPRLRAILAAAGALAAGIALAFLYFAGESPGGRSGVTTPDPEPTGWLAEVVMGVEAEFSPSPGLDSATGRLSRGHYKLSRGEALLLLRNGVQVTVGAPAELELLNLERIVVSKGSLRVHVPENARGFTVISGAVEYEDLGTDFGVQADGAGAGGSVMQVFSGAVNVLSGAEDGDVKKRATLTAGHAWSAAGPQSGPAALRPLSAFPDPVRLRMRRWEEDLRKMDTDTRLVAHFPLRPGTAPAATLTSSVAESGAPPIEAVVSGCQWVTGRWPGKPALQFENPGDAVRFTLPGVYTDLTANFWLKLDRSVHPWTFFWGSAVLKDDTVQFCLHGDIRHFSAQAVTGKGVKTTSVDCGKPFGTWMQITLVLDSSTRETRLYVDGTRSSCYTWTRPDWEFRPGAVTIGRCDDPAAPDAREFRGRVDEFAIWRRALSEEEIQKLARDGQPAPPRRGDVPVNTTPVER